MHRVIMNLQKIDIAENNSKLEVDHRNNDGLDNRKENLRVCTHQQNRANSKLQSNNTSGYKGVVYNNESGRRKRWTVRMKVDNKNVYVGRYLTKEEAASAYNEAAKKYYGEYARLNII